LSREAKDGADLWTPSSQTRVRQGTRSLHHGFEQLIFLVEQTGTRSCSSSSLGEEWKGDLAALAFLVWLTTSPPFPSLLRP